MLKYLYFLNDLVVVVCVVDVAVDVVVDVVGEGVVDVVVDVVVDGRVGQVGQVGQVTFGGHVVLVVGTGVLDDGRGFTVPEGFVASKK